MIDKSEKNIIWWQTVVRKTTLPEISYFFILMEGVVSLKNMRGAKYQF